MNKKFKKFISVNLVLGILFSNILIDAYSGTLSPDTRYETFKGDDIRVEEILENDTVDLELEGNTLVNLYDVRNITLNNGVTVSNGVITAKNVDSKNYLNIFNPVKPDNLKANTEYTLIVNVYENTISAGTTEDEKFANGLVLTSRLDNDSDVFYSDNPYSSYRTFQVLPGETGIFKTLIYTKDDIETDKYFIRTYMCDTNMSSNSKIRFSMVLVEGNHLDRDIDYFEDLKSVGQNDAGEHKLKVVSRGKNLIPNSEGWENGQIKNGNVSTEEIFFICAISTKDYIRLKGGTTYTFSYPSEYQVAYHTWDLQYNYISDSTWLKSNTFTPASDCYIRVTARKIGSYNGTLEQAQSMPTYPSHIGNEFTLQLEEGGVATEYEPQLLDEKEINLKEPLRSLQNGVKDRIVKKDGRWYIERNCGEITLNGSENWRLGQWDTAHVNSFDLNLPSAVYPNEGAYISDKYSTKKRDGDNPINHEALKNTLVSGIDGQLYFVLKKSVLTTRDLSVFKDWLRENNFTVVYQLKTPYYELLDISLTVDLYMKTTQIFNNSAVPSSMKVVVDRVANRAKEFSGKAKENPTVENISQARYWINLMRESSLKDNFQNEINNIIEIEDLTIEKKTASVNSDIYIKIKNTLSLSLDTNSIIFDEVDVTENTEMQKAVNLTVSSSLPYRVNAYLEDEIYNSNKTETLDKSVLNIRASGKSTYQAFTDLSTPIILLDGQEAGVDTVHGIDLRLASNDTHKADIYKTVIKYEVEQK